MTAEDKRLPPPPPAIQRIKLTKHGDFIMPENEFETQNTGDGKGLQASACNAIVREMEADMCEITEWIESNKKPDFEDIAESYSGSGIIQQLKFAIYHRLYA